MASVEIAKAVICKAGLLAGGLDSISREQYDFSAVQRRNLRYDIYGVWMIFQTIGFVGLIFGQDSGSHAAIWGVLATVGFGVGLPAMCIYWTLRLRDWRRGR